MQNDYKQTRTVLILSTFAFAACFSVWVIFAIIGLPIQSSLTLSATEFGLLLSIPILSGSLMRLPLSILSNRFGARNVFTLLMLVTALPLYLISSATAYWQFLVFGLLLGISGASFAVGVSYITSYFPQGRRGVAIGQFGAGSAGAAFTLVFASWLMTDGDWSSLSRYYAGIITISGVLFWLFSPSSSQENLSRQVTFSDQLALIRDPRIWKYCQYYSLVFGGFVALVLWLTYYSINEYQLELATAGLLTAVFIIPFAAMQLLVSRVLHKFSAYAITWSVLWVSWVILFLLSYPQMSLTIKTLTGSDWEFALSSDIRFFTALIFVLGIVWGLGMASVFKALSDDYRENFGVASSVVGLAGGLGGFLLPILFGALLDLTRINTSAFMLLYGATCVSLVLMYFTFGREHAAEIIQEAKDNVIGEARLSSMSSVVAKQRELISSTIKQALEKCTGKLSPVLHDPSTLEGYLTEFQTKLENYKFIYVLDAAGIQITANFSKEGQDESQLGRDRSTRPYMENMFSDNDFELSDSYISRNKKRPSLTAIHVIRNAEGVRIGFLGVDYDLRDLPRQGAVYQGSNEWRQMKGDPSIRGGLFAQERTQSIMDNHIDDVLALLEELMLEHGVFQGKLHFSSSRATIKHISDPYNYHLLSTDELTDPDICLAYPREPYHKKTIVPPEAISDVFSYFRELRFADETIYLRSGSLNTINGMVALNFSCDGSHYLRYDEFLKKGMDFWFGA